MSPARMYSSARLDARAETLRGLFLDSHRRPSASARLRPRARQRAPAPPASASSSVLACLGLGEHPGLPAPMVVAPAPPGCAARTRPAHGVELRVRRQIQLRLDLAAPARSPETPPSRRETGWLQRGQRRRVRMPAAAPSRPRAATSCSSAARKPRPVGACMPLRMQPPVGRPATAPPADRRAESSSALSGPAAALSSSSGKRSGSR